jgi:hypothetical protein
MEFKTHCCKNLWVLFVFAEMKEYFQEIVQAPL